MVIQTTGKTEEAQLLEQLRSGEHAAFARIYKLYWPMLYDKAYARVGDRAAVEELVQEVFVSLWNKRHTLEISTGLAAYLSGAVRNSVFNYYRSRRIHEHYLVHSGHALPSYANGTEDLIYYEELARCFDSGLSKLPDKCRMVYMLSREEGLSYREISLRLALPIDTVEKRMGRALKLLRKHLGAFLQVSLYLLMRFF